jgi:L-ascorbate metabolism protein UlaG (beta-lactamase superfamily)
MFDIEYKGANAVIFTTKKLKVVVDPGLDIAGHKDVAVKDSVVLLTEDRLRPKSNDYRLLFDGPGEYEVGDVSIVGVAARRNIDAEDQGKASTIYRLTIDDTKIAVLGNIAPKLDDDQLEAIGMVDIVVVPVGGGGLTLDSKDAAAIVRQIEPKAVVPVHFDDPALKYEVPQEKADLIVTELSAGVIEAGPKFKLKNASSIPDQLTVIMISRS